MAQLELSALARQCLDRRIASIEHLAAQMKDQAAKRNRVKGLASLRKIVAALIAQIGAATSYLKFPYRKPRLYQVTGGINAV